MASSFDDRELCPDGDCIGIIGAHGRCNQCGANNRGKRTNLVGGAGDEEENWDGGEEEDEEDEENWDEGDDTNRSIPKASPGFDERQLCPDGGCVGLIGAQGSCTTCGKLNAHSTEPAVLSEEE